MTVEINQEKTKLDMPFLASIPYEVLKNTNITGDQKIFFGCLVGLAKNEGYVYALDCQLEEMFGKDERTIQRWLGSLEKEGLISRYTYSVMYKNEKEKRLWKKKRKIYIGNGFSKNKSEPDREKEDGPFEPDTDDGIVEPDTDDGIVEPDTDDGYKRKPSNNKPSKRKQKEVVVEEEPEVVVEEKEAQEEEKLTHYPCFDRLQLSEIDKMKLSDRCGDENKSYLLVKRVMEWAGRESDLKAINTILSKWNTWEDTTPVETKKGGAKPPQKQEQEKCNLAEMMKKIQRETKEFMRESSEYLGGTPPPSCAL